MRLYKERGVQFSAQDTYVMSSDVNVRIFEHVHLIRTDRQTKRQAGGKVDVIKLTVTFPNFANAPKKSLTSSLFASSLLATELTLIVHSLRMFQIAHARPRTHARCLC
jgi:hypothetical protein